MIPDKFCPGCDSVSGPHVHLAHGGFSFVSVEENTVCARLGFSGCVEPREHIHVTNPTLRKPDRAYAVHAPGLKDVRGATGSQGISGKSGTRVPPDEQMDSDAERGAEEYLKAKDGVCADPGCHERGSHLHWRNEEVERYRRETIEAEKREAFNWKRAREEGERADGLAVSLSRVQDENKWLKTRVNQLTENRDAWHKTNQKTEEALDALTKDRDLLREELRRKDEMVGQLCDSVKALEETTTTLRTVLKGLLVTFDTPTHERWVKEANEILKGGSV